MSYMSQTEEYKGFRANIPLKRISVEENKTWHVYDTGAISTGSSPLLCLPPIAGTADVFFKQILALSKRGYRVLAASWPVYWTHEAWCHGLAQLLDQLGLERVHILGAALGGFLAQKFAEVTRDCPRVASLILCNTFIDTAIFNFSDEATSIWMLPALVLRRMVLTGLHIGGGSDPGMEDAKEFIYEGLKTFEQADLASRLTLSSLPAVVASNNIHDLPVTIIDVFDDCSLTQDVRDSTYKSYPSAKLAHLKTGGNFPYLSRSEEVNLYIAIHLRNFETAVA